MPLTKFECDQIDEANKLKMFKQQRSLLRSIRNCDEGGKMASKIAIQLRQHLRPLESLGLIRYWDGYWFTTMLGRDILAEMETRQ